MTTETAQLIAISVGDGLVIVIGEAVIGWILWKLGHNAEDKKLKADAIRDLMANRGDYAGSEFRKALNKVAIIFHDQKEIRDYVRELYDTINDPIRGGLRANRKIVGLIFKLCQENGFDGLSEYDIDQAFTETKQAPEPNDDFQPTPQPQTSSPPPPVVPTPPVKTSETQG